METVIVTIIVALAVVWAGWRLRGQGRAGAAGCASGCGGCSCAVKPQAVTVKPQPLIRLGKRR